MLASGIGEAFGPAGHRQVSFRVTVFQCLQGVGPFQQPSKVSEELESAGAHVGNGVWSLTSTTPELIMEVNPEPNGFLCRSCAPTRTQDSARGACNSFTIFHWQKWPSALCKLSSSKTSAVVRIARTQCTLLAPVAGVLPSMTVA